MASFLRNLALVLLGSLLGAAAAIGYSDYQEAGRPVVVAQAPSPTPAARVASAEERYIDIYQRLSPAVVNISSRRALGSGADTDFEDNGTGSGLIIDEEGHILTNNHVVNRADQLQVTLLDGTRVPAQLMGRDPGNDLALIKIEMDSLLGSKIAVATLGSSEGVKPGQTAIAIGNPFGFVGSMTQGIVSSVGRDYPMANGRLIHNMIQIDAAVNPGNSGGPLIDSTGQVIGINTAIESPIRGFVGVGLAVPISTVRQSLPAMMAGRTVEHPWLGVSGVDLTQEMARGMGLRIDSGVYVVHVLPDSPADRAGVQAAVATRGGSGSGLGNSMPGGGDVVTLVDGQAVTSASNLTAYVDSRQVGDTIKLTLLRDGQELKVEALLAAWPD